MRKKLAALLLAVCLLLSVCAPAGAVTSACFIATNDQLPYDLTCQPYWQSGVVYIPNWVFATFGVYYSTIDTTNMVIVSSASKKLYFDMTGGGAYDTDNNSYTSSAIYCNGAVYLPVDFICQYFGLEYSYIVGTGNGDILRIKDSNVILSDAKFFSAARSLMKSRYESYMASIAPTPTPEPTPTPQPTVDTGSIEVYLTFEGMPTDELLDALSRREMTACFLLRPEDIRNAAGQVRRLVGEGHIAGLLLGDAPQDDLELGAKLLFEAAAVPVTVAGSADGAAAAEAAAANGLAFWDYSIDATAENVTLGQLAVQLQASGDRADLRLSCDAAALVLTEDVLDHLLWSGFAVMDARVTRCPAPPEAEAEVA